MQVTDEGFSAEQILGFGPGRHGGADRRSDRAIHLVVLLLAQPRCERDLENEKLAVERRRIDVVGQSRAVAHAEPEQLRTAREHGFDPRKHPGLDPAHAPSPAATILRAWSMAT